MNILQEKMRHLVSKKKRRFKANGFDLDLTYVTKRIIAMGFPATDLEGTFRNNIEDVTAFFDQYHPGHYKFYNLCSERTYPNHRFHGSFVRYPFDDHNPCPMGMFYFFCKDVEDYLAESPENVVAIHCKAGKGRTGVMISAFLMWCGEWQEPDDAMKFYGFARTNNQRGVTIPSQRRFVQYFRECLDFPPPPDNNPAVMKLITPIVARDQEKLGPPVTTSGLFEDNDVVDDTPLRPCEAEDSDTDDDDVEPRSNSSYLTKNNSGGYLTNGGNAAMAKPRRLGSGIILRQSTRLSPVKTKVLTAEELPALMKEHEAKLYPDGQLPFFQKFSGFMDDEWSKQNRVQTRGFRGCIPAPKVLAISAMKIHRGSYPFYSTTFEPNFTISCLDIQYKSAQLLANKQFKTGSEVTIDVRNVIVSEEVFVIFYGKSPITGSKFKLLCFWFHTSFIKNNRLYLAKEDLDKVCKDKKHNKFSKDYAVEILFNDLS